MKLDLNFFFPLFFFIPNNCVPAPKLENRFSLTTNPIDLTSPSSDIEFMAAGQLGGLLYPSVDIVENGFPEAEVEKIKKTERVKN